MLMSVEEGYSNECWLPGSERSDEIKGPSTWVHRMLSCHAMHMLRQQRTQHRSNDEAQKCMAVRMRAMMLLIDDTLTLLVVRLLQPGQATGGY